MLRFSVSVLLVASALWVSGCTTVRRGVIQGADRAAATAMVVPLADEELVPLRTADGTAIVALFGKATDGEGRRLADTAMRPTVLYFYPGGHTVQRSRAVVDGFRRLGCNVLVPEYPGSGMSAGKATERGCYAAADAAWAWLQTRSDIDRDRIVLAGWSVGGGVAVDLAARRSPAGLIVIGTSTRIRDVVRNLADRCGSTAWIPSCFLWMVTAQCRLDSVAKIPAVACPVLVVYGERDELATKRMAEQLAAAAKPGATLVRIDGVGHGDFFRVNADTLWRELAEWMGELPRTDGP
jgi:fermentation-respiration switch protein FrsA (DUF1100 family)